MTYVPDHWTIIRIDSEEHGTHYRVAASWDGGFTEGKRWKFNSGIVSWEQAEDTYVFTGESGSEYVCYTGAEGMCWYLESIVERFKEGMKLDYDGSLEVISFSQFVKEFGK